MQWLTAILAFATTMLIFAIIVSTIVETIHRALASRTFGLEKMLERFYKDVLSGYIEKAELKDFEPAKFVAEMVNIRGVEEPTGIITKYLSKFKMFEWQKLANLPVAVFMEKLGRSEFSKALHKKPEEDQDDSAPVDIDNKDDILKDIAQKYVAYGEESGVFFERKARSISVLIAFFVAWTFYVHPEALIKTYLESPEIAAKVADMSDDALKRHEGIEKLRKELEKEQDRDESVMTKEEISKLLADIKENLVEGGKHSQLLMDAGAPIGWPADIKPTCLFGGEKSCNFGLSVYLPNTWKDTFWLLMGGLLIGLGAPFWARAIGQIKQGQSAITNVTGILKPAQVQPKTMQVMGMAATATDDVPLTTVAFNVADNAAHATKQE